MKYFIFLLLLFPSLGFSQKTKRFNVADMYNNSISAKGLIIYSDTAQPDTTFLILAHDSRYININQYICIYSGDFEGMLDLLSYCINFYDNEEIGVSETYKSNYLSLIKFLESRRINIHGIDNDKNGYYTTNSATLKRLTKRIMLWKENH